MSNRSSAIRDMQEKEKRKKVVSRSKDKAAAAA
jgi:hypothetical protein